MCFILGIGKELKGDGILFPKSQAMLSTFRRYGDKGDRGCCIDTNDRLIDKR